jgi:hypothetical protein
MNFPDKDEKNVEKTTVTRETKVEEDGDTVLDQRESSSVTIETESSDDSEKKPISR